MTSNSDINPDFFKESQLSLTERLYKITQDVLDKNNINCKIDLEKIKKQASENDEKSRSKEISSDKNTNFLI